MKPCKMFIFLCITSLITPKFPAVYPIAPFLKGVSFSYFLVFECFALFTCNPSFTSLAWLKHPLGLTFFEKSSLTSFLILVCPAAQAKWDINLCFCRLPCFLCCNTYPVFHQILNSILFTSVCSVFSIRLDTAQVLISLANICWIDS